MIFLRTFSEPDPDGDVELETTVGSVTADTGSVANVDSTDMENVDNQISPVVRRPEAELPKVMTQPPALHLPPCSPPKTHALAPPMAQARLTPSPAEFISRLQSAGLDGGHVIPTPSSPTPSPTHRYEEWTPEARRAACLARRAACLARPHACPLCMHAELTRNTTGRIYRARNLVNQ